MFMPSVSLLMTCLLCAAAVADDLPGLGEPVAVETLEQIDYTVLPNGDGLPAGAGSAEEGAAVYLQHCIACHGEEGAGAVNDRLVGGHGSLDSERPIKTIGSYWPYATTVFDYIRRAMPLQQPGILNADEIYAVTAYLLHLNGIIGAQDVMTAETLPAVEMPNQRGFEWAYSP